MIFYLPLLLIVAATAAYHVGQKSVPSQVHPMFSVSVNYVVALLGSLLVLPFYPGNSLRTSFKNMNWSSIVVGIAIIGIELGFLLVYRAGWRISLAALVANVLTALLLVFVGLAAFHEHLKARHIAGVILCIVGLTLVMKP